MTYADGLNDARFPEDSAVEGRYPRSSAGLAPPPVYVSLRGTALLRTNDAMMLAVWRLVAYERS